MQHYDHFIEFNNKKMVNQIQAYLTTGTYLHTR